MLQQSRLAVLPYAVHGEKMIEVKLRFWTNDIAQDQDSIRPKHARAAGVVRIATNKTHGIVSGETVKFHSLLDIGRAVDSALSTTKSFCIRAEKCGSTCTSRTGSDPHLTL